MVYVRVRVRVQKRRCEVMVSDGVREGRMKGVADGGAKWSERGEEWSEIASRLHSERLPKHWRGAPAELQSFGQ